MSTTTTTSTMDELITKVCSKLHVDEAVAKQAIGAILVFLKEQVDLYGKGKFDFHSITDKLKGALQLMNEAPKDPEEAKRDFKLDKKQQEEKQQEESATRDASTSTTTTSTSSTYQSVVAILYYILTVGPIFDIVKKILSTFFGEGAVQMLESSKDSADLMAILSNLGITQETAKKMTTLLVSFLKEKVGTETVEKLGESVPALKPFLEASDKEE